MEESFVKRMKRIARDHTLEISILGLIVGILFFIVGFIGFFPQYGLPYFSDFVESIGNWYWWFMIFSIFFFLPAPLWFMYSNLTDRKRFNDLIDTESKKVFVGHLDELEEIAFRLGTRYQEDLFDKKQELKVK